MGAGVIVISSLGAAVLLLSAGMLMEIDARAGPFEERLLPATTTYQVTGTYSATGPRGSPGPAGTCIPESASVPCAPARLDVSLRFAGLPILGQRAHYIVFLTGPAVLRLGPLVEDDTGHALQVQQERDAREMQRLIVTLETRPDASAPSPLQVYARDVAGQGRTSPASLSGTGSARVVEGEGHVRLAEIGAMSKSVVALGELRASVPSGWTYQGWFVSIGATPSFIPVDPFEWSESEPGVGVLDVRIENLRVEDQAAFLVTLEPMGSTPGEAGPGFPAFVARMQV